jgi:hypothetical protein
MQVRSDTPATPTYAVGERVFGAIDGCPGTVVSVSTVVAPVFSVVWSTGRGEEIIYPMDTIMIRKAWPWET